MLLAVDTIPPIADPERQARLGEQARIARAILLDAFAAKPRPLAEDLGARATAQALRAEHLFPGGDGGLEDRRIDLTVEDMIGSGVAIVGHAAFAVAQVLGESEQRGAITKGREPHEGLATLMRRQSPGRAVVQRQVEECSMALQVRDHLGGGEHANGPLRNAVPLAGAEAMSTGPQPELIAPCPRPMGRGQGLENRDRVHHRRWHDPLMWAAVERRLALEQRAANDGEAGIGLTL